MATNDGSTLFGGGMSGRGKSSGKLIFLIGHASKLFTEHPTSFAMYPNVKMLREEIMCEIKGAMRGGRSFGTLTENIWVEEKNIATFGVPKVTRIGPRNMQSEFG